MLEKTQSFIERPKTQEGFDPIVIRSLWELDKFETKTLEDIDAYKKSNNGTHLHNLANKLSEKIVLMQKEGVETGRGGIPRGGAFFQGFVERMLVRGKMSGDMLANPNFITKIRERFGEEMVGRIEGARSVQKVVQDLRRDPKCVFIGSHLDLDTMGATDLVAGYGEHNEEGEMEHPYLDRVDLIQVKTGRIEDKKIKGGIVTREEQIDEIIKKHQNYTQRIGRFMDVAVQTDFERHLNGIIGNQEMLLDHLSKMEPFYRAILEAPDITTYEDLERLSINLDKNVVEIYHQIVTESPEQLTTTMYAGEQEMNAFMRLRQSVANIKIPTRVLLDYRRMTNPNYVSIVGAGKYRSIIKEKAYSAVTEDICTNL